MATIVKTVSGTWKALIRKQGWPSTSKTFRTKRDAEDWARRTEDEMVRGMYIQRAPAERMSVEAALRRYLKEITPTKSSTTQVTEIRRAELLIAELGAYSLAALTPDLVAEYRDKRLAGEPDKHGIQKPRSNNTVRLELALLGHLYSVAIKEWGIGLVYNPVQSIRRPSPGPGRNRRLSVEEENHLLAAVNAYSNPQLGWIVRIALETGMRAGEISSLRCHQVDLKRGVVHLQMGLDTKRTKNQQPRLVPLGPVSREQFKQALANPARPHDTDLIFFGEPGRDGRRRPYQFNPAWLAIKKQLGMSDLRFHDLRHEAVSRLVELGWSDQKVAAVSGHKSMQMLRRYTHLRAEDLVAELNEAYLKKQP